MTLPIRRLPDWMKTPLPSGKDYITVKNLTASQQLNTICVSGNCPNKAECWGASTASFMILGEKCTRNCRFCDVKNMIPDAVDMGEPYRLAETIQALKIRHCVITSVTRDDLPDGGADFWALTIRTVKELNPGITMETLIPDFYAINYTLAAPETYPGYYRFHTTDTVTGKPGIDIMVNGYNGGIWMNSQLGAPIS